MDRSRWSGRKKFFYVYIEAEIKRNTQRIKDIIGEKNRIIIDILKKSEETLKLIKQVQKLKPVICWYDINSNNILVNDKSEITGFLDPGGARFAPKEWDLAFVKMDLCRNEKEFKFFLDKYMQNNNVDINLLNLLSVIVEIDDIAFQLETRTKLPIAFDSNFKSILKIIQN